MVLEARELEAQQVLAVRQALEAQGLEVRRELQLSKESRRAVASAYSFK